MSRKLNLGFAALIAMAVFAAAFAISHRAALPDAASCVGRMVEDARNGGPAPGKPRPNCRVSR